jgi:predicted acyltransferase
MHYENSRLISLDALRGSIVAGMILVTDPGTYSAVYWPLLHARWDGVTPTDMIFPAFLVIVGVATTLSFASRLERGANQKRLMIHVLRRSGILLLLGLLMNGFPDYDWHTIRIPGVLQRIALCYLAGSLLYLVVSNIFDNKDDVQAVRRSSIIGAALLAILALYWALLKLYPVPGFGTGRLDSLGNLGAYIDRSVLGVRHMWAWGLTPGYGVTFDPEGLLSTLPAVATLLIGVLAGEWMRTSYSPNKKVAVLACGGIGLAVAGLMLSDWLPLNKKIWTSTFAIFSAGVALLAFSLFYWILDVRHWRAWAAPTLVLGTNAIFAFVVSGIITTLMDRIHVTIDHAGSASLRQWAYQEAFATWLKPVHASLAYAIAIVILNIVIVYPLYSKRIFLRV